jgi:hypothetical protein
LFLFQIKNEFLRISKCAYLIIQPQKLNSRQIKAQFEKKTALKENANLFHKSESKCEKEREIHELEIGRYF